MFNIRYHRDIHKKDFKKIPANRRRGVLKQIQKKLTKDPANFGKPLGAELKGYFRLRVEDYRVVYRIHDQKITVYIIQIGLRRDKEVYQKAARRLGLI